MRAVAIFLLACVFLPAQADDHSTAVWIIRQGGRVRVAAKPDVVIGSLPALPAPPYRVIAADLIGTLLDPVDLKRLGTLTELRELLLPGPSFNPGAGSKLDANDEFAGLATLTKLEKLHFSLHFLTNVNVRDKGLEKIKNLTSIREMRLTQTNVKGPSLAAFVNLEKLDLDYSIINDDGLKALAGLKNLKSLRLRDTILSDKGMPHLSGLVNLEHLDLYGARLTDAGVAALAPLKKLRSLDLLGAQITDESAAVLAGFKELEELDVYRSQLSNAGLAKLEALPKLRHVDVRYSRVTRAGVDKLARANPKCKVEFMDASALTVAAGLRQSKPASGDPQAVAAWVRQLGGSAHFAGGRLSRIDLSRTPVTDGQLVHLRSLAGLDELRLDSTEISTLEGLPAVRQLNIANTQVGAKALSALPAGVERLDLGNLSIGDEVLARLPDSLRGLRLAHSDVTSAGVAGLSRLKRLEWLDLTSTDIDDASLAGLAGLSALTDLRLNYGRFTDKGLAAVAGLKNLERLELMRTRVTDAGLKHVAGLTKLEVLWLDYTNTSDAGLKILPPGLVDLRLDTANISDAGVETLKGFRALKHLNLYHTTVTEAAYEGLKKALPGARIVYDRESSLPTRRKS